ncbi:MAG: response regulator [Deltaproteobacteria bacterium]|nr:response regulator [Deltaproteobacteria bacterium]
MEKVKVLLVDDEEEFVSTLAERLRLRKITTLVATDGDEALQIINTQRPPIVVLDVMMPGMGGLDVLHQIKRNYPHIQVILLTGRGSTKDGIKGMRLGAFDYLMKPVNIEKLIDKMNEAFQASKQEIDRREAT